MKGMLKRVAKLSAVALGVVLLAVAAAYFYFLYAPTPSEPALSASIQESVIDVGGRERSFRFYVPANLPANAPLVFVFHGSLQDAGAIRVWTGYEFERLADENKFAVVYPNGYRKNWNDCRKAASYPARAENIDDKAFVLALAEKFAIDYQIDPQRVFAAGYSNGGHLAFRLALEMPEKIAAIAVFGANLPAPENNDCDPVAESIPVMIVNGTADPVNPFDGGKVTLFGFGDRGPVLSSRETAEYFARINGAPPEPEIVNLPRTDSADPTAVNKFIYAAQGRPEVVLIRIEGGGHVVPQPVFTGWRIFGPTSRGINAPAEVWNFFARQRRDK